MNANAVNKPLGIFDEFDAYNKLLPPHKMRATIASFAFAFVYSALRYNDFNRCLINGALSVVVSLVASATIPFWHLASGNSWGRFWNSYPLPEIRLMSNFVGSLALYNSIIR